MRLVDLEINRRAVVTGFDDVPVKIMEMGLMQGTTVEVLRKSRLPKMLLVRLDGSVVALPLDVAEKIKVEPVYEEKKV